MKTTRRLCVAPRKSRYLRRANSRTPRQVFTPGEAPDTTHFVPFEQRDSFTYTLGCMRCLSHAPVACRSPGRCF